MGLFITVRAAAGRARFRLRSFGCSAGAGSGFRKQSGGAAVMHATILPCLEYVRVGRERSPGARNSESVVDVGEGVEVIDVAERFPVEGGVGG